MPRKIDLITELYRRTIKGITSDSVAWRALLHSAAYQYKYPFADQVLIYAQQPKATACAELELWNKHFDRWVKRGATGIALIAGNPNGGKMYLNHVFDVADTHHREDKPFKLWSVSPSFEEDVVEALENRFGDLGKKNSFTDAVISACINLGQDNLHDYLRELEYSTEGSFLEELDEDNLRYRLQLTVQASVAYTVLSRLGYDADIYVGAEAFEWVHEFNTPATVNILGNATGDISEICLREIEKTVKSIERSMQKENRIFDGSGENRYNDGGKEPTEQNNGGNDYGNHLQNGERREAAEPQPARADRLPDREVWTDEIEFYEEPSQGDLHDTSDRGQAERISARDGADGAEQAFGDYIPDGTEPWGNGGAESDQPNEVGADDEQHQELGGGGNSEQSDLRISAEDELYAYEGKGIAPQYLDTEISGGLPPPSEETLVLALRHGDYLHKSKLSIVSFLMTESDPQKKVDYVKKAYEMGLTGEFFRPGTEEHIGYHVEPKGLVIYEGNYPTHKTEAKFSWELVTDLIEALMKEGRYLDDAREGQQLSFMDVAEPTVEREALVTVESINDRQQSTQAEKSLINEDFGDTEYNLTLGATVHIGKDEMEILSLSAEKVELFDGTLIPYELPTDVFLTRLRENPLNDALLKEPKAISTSVITEQKKEPKKTKKRKDKEPTMESLAASITETYERWNFYLNGGGSDPTWEDGGNMNLLRNHILYYRRQMEDICKDGNFSEIYYRELPPEMPMKYMAQPEKIREDARRALALYKANPTYQWCRENLSRIPEKELKKSTIPAIMGYVSGLEKFIEQDKLVDMRRHRNPNYYMESFDSCRKQMETILERVSRDELTDSIFDSLMNESEQDEEVQDEIDFAETEPEGAEEEKPLSLFEKYEHLKEKYPGFILAVRVGDFYEFFDESAKIVSEQLGLTLTSRSFPDGNRYPMCGVPQHRKDEFFGKLIEAKYSIACYDEDGEVLIEPASVTEETREVDAELDSLPISTAIDGEVRTFPNEDAMLEAMGTAPMPTMQEKPKEKVSLPVYHAHPDIPDSKKHNYRITDNEIGMGGAKEKFRKNIAAINFLHELEAQNRLATPEEQEVLAQYSGWGGLADAFDETKDHWHSEFTELYTTLSPEEYEAAKESTLTAFYTPPVIIKAMYKALENMGFKRGNILEPSCGVGNFMGLVPEGMDAKMYGVELDSLSGRIARQLYQKNGITIDGYEKTQFPDSFFDVAIGNVPFNDFKLLDKKYDKYNFLIHDYFFAKTLDKVRPGGVIAFITSSGTLDKENPSVRKYISQRADFLGAIRLPNNTFDGAGANKVISDIIFLQKGDRIVERDEDWVHLGVDENGIRMNQYFIDNPDMIMGEMVMCSGPYGPEPTCKAYDGEELGELLDEAVSNIHAEIAEVEREEGEGEQENKSIPADPTVKNFSFTLVDGKVYYLQNSVMNPVETSMTGENRIKGMIGIRDTVRELIDAQLAGESDNEIKSLQARLNVQYDAFTAKYGLINSRGNAAVFSDDNSYFLLCSLEILDENKALKAKADMFTKRTINPEMTIDHVDTATEALAVSIGERAMVDMDYMSKLTGKSEQELFSDLKGVIFLNPHYGNRIGDKKYLMADEYLSGNVREKLECAKRSAELYPDDYSVNVEALERVQPVDLGASEIGVRLGSTWIPDEDIQAFVHELLGTPYYMRYRIIVKFVPQTAQWVITDKKRDYGNVKANNTYGTHRINAYEIIEDSLNLKDVRVFDYVDDGNGNKKAVLNKKETTIAQGKQEQIKAAFEEWIWKDPARRERLCRLYNDKFNSTRPREFDGSHIKFYGMTPEITLRKHQADAVARIMYGGNALLAHVVGAGKTFTMVAAAQESKRLGLCNKSMFVVPNHLIEQWASEYLQLYPSANILVATKKDFETKNRKKFCARIATGDYDAIIIGHSQFEKIPMSVERQIQTIEGEIETILQGMEEVKRERGDRVTVKQLAKAKKQLETRLKKLNDQTRKDDVVTFEELGVDRLFVDEAHFYKNLAAYSKMRNVAGISQVEAQKSSDLYMKCRYLDEMTGGKGCVFATGTPISNTMVELYTMQKYLQYDELRARGLLHFDAWASTFGETVTAIELSPDGTGYRAKTRFAKFFNIPELMAMFKQTADIQTADMLKLPVPEAHYHVVKVEASEIQKELVQSFAERAERIHNRMVTSDEDNMLLVTNDGRKAALDQRLIDPLLSDFDGSKVNTCVRSIYEIWEKNADKKSAQLVFCDLSTPKNDGSFNVYDDIRSKLIAMGIPAEEIAFIHSADTDVKKKELFVKVRRGQVRVLMGSTFKMGAGTNVQERLIALHDLDVPWRPSDLEQRAGRIVRQGNTNPEVDLFRYVIEGTFDAYSYQLLESKQKFISQIMTSKSPVRSAEDVDETALSYAEIKALASGNPLIMEKMQLDTDVAKLKLQKADHLSQRYSLEDSLIKKFPKDIAEVECTIRGLESDIETEKASTTPNEKGFSPMTIMGIVYTEKANAGHTILELCSRINNPKPRPLGSYRGFDMEIGFDTADREFFINLRGELLHRVALGKDAGGIITRIDNQIEALAKRKDVCLERLAELHKQVENAKIEIAKPFAREDELAEKSKRLAEVNAMLDMDKRENELCDGVEEQSEDEQEKKDRSVDDRDDR